MANRIKEIFKRKKSNPDENIFLEKIESGEKDTRFDFYKADPRLKKLNREKTYSELSRELVDKIENPERVILHNIDPVFLVLFIIAAAFAFIVSLSATNAYADTFYDDKFYFVWQNIKFLLIGAVLIIASVAFAKNLRAYAMFTLIGFGVTILLLVLVLLIGREAGGAKRWLEIAGFSMQPSELAKTALVLLLALYMSIYHDKITDNKNHKNSLVYGLLIPAVFIGIIVGLVYLEKHNSGMIIIAVTGFAVLFLGGTRKKWLIILGVIGVVALVVLMLATGHGVDRIDSWLNSNGEITDDNWQSTQGLYAISSGGLFGLGPGQSRLKYGYVSQPQNDFIFPIICEELGFVGGMAVLLLFFAIFYREMKLAMNANNMFASIAISGLAIKLMFQVLLNICVVTGIIPNTGISLPLFSAGGSAMVFQLLEFGIVLGLSRYCDVKS